jgi:hypothetical protein
VIGVDEMKLRSSVSVGVAVLVGVVVVLFELLGMGRLAGTRVKAQGTTSGRVPTIEEYQPKSTLLTPEHNIERAKYPFVDIHSHHWNPTAEHVEQVVKEMGNQSACAGESEWRDRRRSEEDPGGHEGALSQPVRGVCESELR